MRRDHLVISHGKADKSSFPNNSHFLKLMYKPREGPSDEMRSSGILTEQLVPARVPSPRYHFINNINNNNTNNNEELSTRHVSCV